MKTLIVEDDPVSRTILKKTLDKAGYDTITAEDGLEAWNIFQAHNISLIISDWMMPNMDGIELCKKIRQTRTKNYVYFIVLTARDSKEDLIEVFEAGADDYISKPLDTDEVEARIMTGARIVRLEQKHNVLLDILIESKNKLVSVFDALEEEIISVDSDLKIISANKAVFTNMNVPFNEIIGSNLLDICAKREVQGKYESIAAQICKTFESGKTITGIHNLKDNNGEKRYKAITYIPVKSNNKTTQVVVSSRDITESTKKSEKIDQLNKELENALTLINH